MIIASRTLLEYNTEICQVPEIIREFPHWITQRAKSPFGTFESEICDEREKGGMYLVVCLVYHGVYIMWILCPSLGLGLANLRRSCFARGLMRPA